MNQTTIIHKMKRGFTLMELLVYMAIVGIVVVIAGQVYSDSTKMRIRTQGMIEANQVAENVAALLKDDVAQMGAKSKKDASADQMIVVDDVMKDPSGATPDYSSFAYSMRKNNSGYNDSLNFLRVRYDDDGNYVSVEEVAWYLDGATLKRSCKTKTGDVPADGSCPKDNPVSVDVAENVTNFMLTPAKPSTLGSDGVMFPNYVDANKKAFNLIPYVNNTSFFLRANSVANASGYVTLSGFTTNYKPDGSVEDSPVKHMFFLSDDNADASSWRNCHAFTFEKNKVYEAVFEMAYQDDNSKMFLPGKDHMAIGIRSAAELDPLVYPDVPDFLFYPPEVDAGSGERVMRFSMNSETEATYSACLAFTFALYSPSVSSGSFVIKNMKVRKVIEANYVFEDEYEPNVYDKKNVRAFRLKMDVTRKGENGHVEMVVPVPSNGTKG